MYELDISVKEKTIYRGRLNLGGSNLSGERLEVNSYYMSVGGNPVIPVMGEFHCNSYLECQREEEILKNEGRRSDSNSYVCILEHSRRKGRPILLRRESESS